MRFLRVRKDEVERAWIPDRTAAEMNTALHALGDAVVLARHPYQRFEGSGAGNCWCGWGKSSKIHGIVVDPDSTERVQS